jgi:hypothetical protein
VNSAVKTRSVSLALFRAVILLFSLGIACIASAGGGEQQVYDVGTDYAIGMEDYSETIRLHVEVVRKSPDNALAHYHLGFVQGMLGNRTAEVSEERSAALGLRNWDLFLNLGLAQLENDELDAGTDSLRTPPAWRYPAETRTSTQSGGCKTTLILLPFKQAEPAK